MNKKETAEFATVKNDIKHIKSEQADSKKINREEHKAIMVKLDDFDKKFASKWVERAFITLSVGLLGTVLYAVIFMI